jgi:uncharacterized damage-inducible protein DinB
METYNETAPATVITPQALLEHWQGHRGLTRRVIEAFPEKELFTYTIGGMRTFAVMAMELVDLTNPGIEGIVTGEWKDMGALPHNSGAGMPEDKEALLALWDETTDKLNRLFARLTPQSFQEMTTAFGQYENTVIGTILYFIDNEIHHRGQGYVYLRSLGIEPPAFWDR